MELKKDLNESDLEYIKRIVYGKLIDKTIDKSYEELSPIIFGEENCYSEDECRKRTYGVKHMYELLDKYNIDIKQNKNEDRVKCLIMNDVHLPYQRHDILDEIAKHKDANYIIFAGDLVDCESCSFFKSFKHPSVSEELVIVHDFITEINKIINPEKTEIIAIKGNHEERYKRQIIEMRELQLQKMLNPKLLSMIEEGFTFYEDSKSITYNPIKNFKYIDEWYVKLFDNLIVAHPTQFSVVDGKVSEKIAEYFLNQYIADKDDIVIYGHTHKFSNLKINRRQGLFILENGSMCKPMEYANRGKLTFTPQNYGYSIVQFKKGEKIDINDVKFIHLE